METAATPGARVTCPDCGASLRTRAGTAGRRIRCPKCNAVIETLRASHLLTEPAAQSRSVLRSSREPSTSFGDVLPIIAAAGLLVLSAVQIGALLPSALGEGGETEASWLAPLSRTILTWLLVAFGLRGALSALFLFRVGLSRIPLVCLTAVLAIVTVILSLFGMQPVGFLWAVIHAAASVILYRGAAENYVAGGPPSPRISLAVALSSCGAALAPGILVFAGAQRVRSRVADPTAPTRANVQTWDVDLIEVQFTLLGAVAKPPPEQARVGREVLERLDGLERSLCALEPQIGRKETVSRLLLSGHVRLMAVELAPLDPKDLSALRAGVEARLGEATRLSAAGTTPIDREIRKNIALVKAQLP